jgi:hypothetical protein
VVVVQIIGGLGNQMFQYAFGRAIQCRQHIDVKYDIAGFNGYELREFSLTCFSLQCDIASLGEVKKIKGNTSLGRLKRGIIDKVSKWYNRSIVKEPFFHFSPEIFNVGKKDAYLQGYWQSEKYFKEFEHIIRQDFSFRDEMKDKVQIIANKIMETNSISLHIRRGDYVSNSEANAQHGTCSLEYYHMAINNLKKEIEEPYIFIFSDDIEWAKQNLRTNIPMFFVEPFVEKEDTDDLRLMSLCKHHIIANSTFSWWGAWLSENPDKIVYAPKQWFKADNHDIRDLIPVEWRKI